MIAKIRRNASIASSLHTITVLRALCRAERARLPTMTLTGQMEVSLAILGYSDAHGTELVSQAMLLVAKDIAKEGK